jgi:transcriptional activator of cad operon
MEGSAKTKLKVGDWLLNSANGEISRGSESIRLDARAAILLQCLAERAGEVVSIEELLDRGWPGVAVSQDSVYQAVASLRRQLGDDPKQPKYIATVPRLGYRMVAAVTPWMGEGTGSSGGVAAARIERPRVRAKWAVLALVLAGIAIASTWAVLLRDRAAKASSESAVLASQNQRSIAVLPFLDLTDGMKEEEFADGMTEELIDRLSKNPGFRVPAATSSFYFKEKHVPLADIAKALNVVYLLDGSVRKSAGRFRVAARLVRAENGFVIWSETYDRPLVDKILVQEDIAGEVAKALRTEIAGKDPAR